MQFAGDFLIFAGCVFIALGVVRVVADLVTSFRPKDGATARDVPATIDSVTKLIEAIVKLPPFVLTTIVGVFLIAAGQRLLAGLQILPF